MRWFRGAPLIVPRNGFSQKSYHWAVLLWILVIETCGRSDYLKVEG
jgi:hypothetical protein